MKITKWSIWAGVCIAIQLEYLQQHQLQQKKKQISFFQVWIFQWSKLKAFHTFAKRFVINSLMRNLFAILSKIHISIRFAGLLVKILFEKMHMWFEFSMRPAWKLLKLPNLLFLFAQFLSEFVEMRKFWKSISNLKFKVSR